MKSYQQMLAELDHLEVEADKRGGLDGEEQGLFDRARARLRKRIQQDHAQLEQLASTYKKP